MTVGVDFFGVADSRSLARLEMPVAAMAIRASPRAVTEVRTIRMRFRIPRIQVDHC
jgi:hypothetical protein